MDIEFRPIFSRNLPSPVFVPRSIGLEYQQSATGKGGKYEQNLRVNSFEFTALPPRIRPNNLPRTDVYMCVRREPLGGEVQFAAPPPQLSTMHTILGILVSYNQ